jgi:copper(I)-binding protein
MMKRQVTGGIAAVFFVVLALAAAPGTVPAKDMPNAKISIKQPWARIILMNRPAAGYMQVHNGTGNADAIIAASSPLAERVELHRVTMQNNVMKMRPVAKVPVPAGAKVEFKQGGYHLMIFGLKHKPKPGDKLPLTLVFEKAGKLKMELIVNPTGKHKMNKMQPGGGHKGH